MRLAGRGGEEEGGGGWREIREQGGHHGSNCFDNFLRSRIGNYIYLIPHILKFSMPPLEFDWELGLGLIFRYSGLGGLGIH